MKQNRRTLSRAAWSFAALALLVPVLLAGCGNDDETADETTTTTEEATSTAPEVSDVWARQVQDRGAVYMVIKGGSEADALTKAEVPADIAGTVEIHETVMADEGSSTTMGEMGSEESTTTTMGDMAGGEGSSTTMGEAMQMEMKPVDKIDIPAGGTVELKPGGYHVMLLDVKKTLNPGDTFDVTLTFEKAGTQTVTAEVREA